MSEFDIDGVYTQTFQIKKYRFSLTNLVLHTSVTMVILLINADNNEVHRIFKLIEGEEYDAWGLDDSYLDKIAEDEVKGLLKPTATLSL